MTIKEYLKNNILYLDGGTGTLLQAAGLKAGEVTESWNLSHPDELVKIHKAYFDSGSNVVATNTFGVNTLKYSAEEVEKNVISAVENAKKARTLSTGKQEKFIALDVGPLGRLLKPIGDLDFEDAVKAFSTSIKVGAKAGVDLIFIETMNDSLETKAALLAAKENSDLPVFVSNAYGEDGRLMSGASPEVMVAMLESMGAAAIGVNCSLGPNALAPIVEKYLELSSIPIICKPNAGLPRVENGKTVFDVTPKDFANQMETLAKKGALVLGGCCGTTPEYIKELVAATKDIKAKEPTKKQKTVISSGTKTVDFDNIPVLIGERINPTGKKRLKQALAEKDLTFIIGEGIKQAECGANVLDVNVGAPDIDEKEMLHTVSEELQSVCDLPLQLDSADPIAMEKALRVYNGKALINSVNGKEESMKAVFPLVKKYGGTVIALTLDESGIPSTARGRVEIAKRIIDKAKEYGIDKKDIVFDPLTLTVSAEKDAANVTLEALREIRYTLGCHTSLGVSNVSFGLPNRAGINSVFFTMALENGLSAAIMNPFSAEMMNSYYSFRALRARDENCLDFIGFANSNEKDSTATIPTNSDSSVADTLKDAVIKGLKEKSAKIASEMLKTCEPLSLVSEEIIPALNEVGESFEKRQVFLPQLLMSAEAAGSAFEVIKASYTDKSAKNTENKVILATVKGDIHDIGKNIVKLLLENYGFNVYDLGRDVDPKTILETALKENIKIIGLSALMTTTVPAMEETVKLVHEKAPFAKVVVGGAVLTKDYAEKIGADFYSATAMDTVRYAQSIYNI